MILKSWKHPYIAKVGIFLIAVALIVGTLGCPPTTYTLDHFKCYAAKPETTPYVGEVVYLEDQFGAINATVSDEWPLLFGNNETGVFFCDPVEKVHDGVTTPISNPDHHLTLYSLNYTEEPQMWFVEVDNQFGTQNLTVSGPFALAVPTQKVAPGGHEPPVGLDHFLIYYVIAGPSLNVTVDMKDQFRTDTDVLVYEPFAFANPVQKTHDDNITEIMNPEAHLVFYAISADFWEGPEVQVVNQFGGQTFNLFQDPVIFAVPSEKLYYEPIS
jgi:hypothetical protein